MSTSSVDSRLFPPSLAGQYAVEREVGRGGMGIVYLARDLKLDRRVAIKTLPPHLAADPDVRERFLREARTAAALSHPNIVPIHRADELGDFVFFAMGYVDGESLAQRIRREGAMAPSALLPILIDVALALGYAHSRGVVHRDIKAENILLDAHGTQALVTDFGIARVAQSAPLTQTGTVLGTVFYMSPEQVAGDALDGRSDLYSFGVLAFYALTGRFPFQSETPSAVLVAHVTKAAPPIRSVAPRVPSMVAAVVDRLLEKDPAARFEDADDLVDALRAAELRLPPDATDSVADSLLSATEANAVWERAALLQEMTGQVVPPPDVVARAGNARAPATLTSGYRVGEVRDAAAEIGIGAKYVDRALAERGSAAADGSGEVTIGAVQRGAAMQGAINPLVGEHRKIEFEIVVDGELVDQDFEEVADEIRRSVGDLGSLNTIGRTITWTPVMNPTSPRLLQISVSSRHGRTAIHGFEDLKQICGGILGGVTGGVGGGVGGMTFGITMGATNGAVLIAAPLFAGIALAAYGGARAIFAHVSRKRQRELQATLERVAERVRACVAHRRLERSPAARRLRGGRE